ncbi:hypothetical protein GW17_00010047 [Ensete ventricosum]|nr:hypothetical protein GW17_00010047 [Ensete ventricosum]
MSLLVMSPVEAAAGGHQEQPSSPDSTKRGGAKTDRTTTLVDAHDELDLLKLLRAWIPESNDIGGGGGGGGDDEDDGGSKFRWLRSQIIGAEAEFETPFGRRRITYSDHTASGRFLRFVEEFLQRDVLPFYGNTHTVDSHVGLYTGKLVQQASHYVKQCMGASPHDVLLFCGSGSTAAIKRLQEVMGIAVPSILRSAVLSHLPPSERWVIFVGPHEHHSNLLSWRESLAEVVEIGLDASGATDLAALDAALQSPEFSGRMKLGSFSACSNVTGMYADTRAIARMLHLHGAYACFDFACSGPYVDIEMRRGELDGYDAVYLSPHKFIGGPGSPGILVLNDELYRIRGNPPSTSGGGTVLYVSSYDKDTLYCKDVEEREDAGTPAIVQKIRAATAFRVKEWAGHGAIKRAEARLLRRALGRILGNPRVRVLGSATEERQPVLSFLVHPPDGTRGSRHLHCRFVTRLLNDLFGIQARGGCACAGPYGHVLLGIDRGRSKAIKSAVEKGYEGIRPGWTRVSFAYYTLCEEMEFVVDAIEFVAQYGDRFLQLYSFDWKTGDWEYIMHGKNVIPIKDGEYIGNTYDEYMTCARGIVDFLPHHTVERHVPEGIDPELVNFML